MPSKKILFIGCGKMGSAILDNVIANNENKNVIDVVDPSLESQTEGVNSYKSLNELGEKYKADIVFIAVKPQIAKEVLIDAKNSNKIAKNALFISIIAGKKVKFFRDILGKNSKIIRTMPNLPLIENKGVFAYHFSSNIRLKDRYNLTKIFSHFGQIVEIDKEKKFDRFTAVFGSGPAYIFYLQELLLKQTESLGINEYEAKELIRQLFLGSSLMSSNSELDFHELKKSVTSEGGTTQAGLDVLSRNNALEKLINKTVKAAAKRSKELS